MATKYKKTYLNKVIIRADFFPEFKIRENNIDSSITKEIINRFPIEEPVDYIKHEVEINAKKEEISHSSGKALSLNYYGRKKEKHLSVNEENIFIEYSIYDSFENLKNDFLFVFNSLLDFYKDITIKRLGLRYVNVIDFTNNDNNELLKWDKYINNNMLCIFQIVGEDDKKFVSRAFHNLEINYGNMNLRVQYGMHNPDYPACIRKKVFILDFDGYFQGIIEKGDIESNLIEFHGKIYEMFEKSIKDDLRRLMNNE